MKGTQSDSEEEEEEIETTEAETTANEIKESTFFVNCANRESTPISNKRYGKDSRSVQ